MIRDIKLKWSCLKVLFGWWRAGDVDTKSFLLISLQVVFLPVPPWVKQPIRVVYVRDLEELRAKEKA